MKTLVSNTWLAEYRRIRAFNPEGYLYHKFRQLDEYFAAHQITAAVVGVSGGVDSAVVLGLLSRLSKRSNSRLKRVVGVVMPVHRSAGATNQATACSRALEVIRSFEGESFLVDLSEPAEHMKRQCDAGMKYEGQPWALGQLVSYIRTPALYYIANALAEQGTPCIVAGTTNRDEGAYIGFFGKASDGMVDIQAISDIHKSEVYALARYLGVPQSVVEAVPSGDVYDSRGDEEMIGAPYDSVELLQQLLTDTERRREQFFAALPPDELRVIRAHFGAIEALHRRNRHKYLAGSPAIHFDVYEREVPDGWESGYELGPILHRQIRRDPIYRSALPIIKSSNALAEAGLFQESADPALIENHLEEYSWYTTPLFHVRRRLGECEQHSAARKAVIVTTGALCPPHRGHLHLMEQSRRELEARGYHVLGGFLSPSHDEYVSAKCGANALSAIHRIALCQEVCLQTDWLAVDTWESLYTGCDINFTRTVWRLQEYIRRHLERDDIEVFYACGGDRAAFALSFVAQGGCVVIPRQAEDNAKLRLLADNPLLRNHPRIVIASESPAVEGSSSQVRDGDLGLMEKRSSLLWNKWRDVAVAEPPQVVLLLRDEGCASMNGWLNYCSEKTLESARCTFIERLRFELERNFLYPARPDTPFRLEVRLMHIDEQRRLFKSLSLGKTVSLDSCLSGDYNIGCSRHFEFGASARFLGIGPRPGWPELDVQISNIPSGAYTLIDDDRSSGSTLAELRARSEGHWTIDRTVFLSELEQGNEKILDLGDIRDFIPGAPNGGLVVRLLSGKTGRTPYILPYVFPSERVTAPVSSNVQLSRAVWAIARKFFEQVPLPMSQSDPGFQAAMHSIGLEFDWMSDLCAWHMERLTL